MRAGREKSLTRQNGLKRVGTWRCCVQRLRRRAHPSPGFTTNVLPRLRQHVGPTLVRTKNTPLSRRVPPPTRNTADGLPSRRWTKAWKLGRFTVLASAIEDRRTHRRSAKAHGVAALRDISAADDLGPRTTNVAFLPASALSTSARGTGTLPTTACDGCSPGLPLTTNPPLGRWCASSGDPAGSGHGTEPSASRRRNRQQPSGRPDRGVGAPMWRPATALYSCQADTRTPRLVVVTPETGEAPWDG